MKEKYGKRSFNNSGTETVIIIPEGYYFKIEPPKEDDFGNPCNSIVTKKYNYKNYNILFSETEIPDSIKSNGIFITPVGSKLYTYSLDNIPDREKLESILETAYFDTRYESNIRPHKIHTIPDTWDSQFS